MASSAQEALSPDDQLKEAVASLRYIATSACRCSNEEDLLSNCDCDAAQTALETLREMGVGLRP